MTAIEYNKWLVENDAKEAAIIRKLTHDEERKLRQEMQEKYRSAGQMRAKAIKENRGAGREGVEALQATNAKRGSEVKEQVDALRKTRRKQKDAWLEHSHSLCKELGSEQKARIASQIGAMTTRKSQQSKALRAQYRQEEHARAERKGRERDAAQKLKADIASATSDAVTQAAKDSFYQQRKTVGDATRTDMKAWSEGRKSQKEEYAAKAKAAKLEAAQTKKAAKEALQGVNAAKATAAKEMREKMRNIRTNFRKVKSDLSASKKETHDMTRTRKYVSEEAAEEMRQKKEVKAKSP